MIYINLAQHCQPWRQFETDHHSLSRSAGGSADRKWVEEVYFALRFLFYPQMAMNGLRCEWALQSVATFSADGKLHEKSIKCMLFSGNI